jgi:hypothetical protein
MSKRNFLTLIGFKTMPIDGFQDNARILLWVRNFTTMSQAWHCICGQLFNGHDLARALGCRSLNSLIIARHDETADALREYAGRIGFSSSREGPYMRRGFRTTNRPGLVGTSTATSVLGPVTF